MEMRLGILTGMEIAFGKLMGMEMGMRMGITSFE